MIKGGPKIINDSLVLCLDAHDADSYGGEPTTNLISNGGFENNTTSGWSFDPKTTGSFSVTSDDKKSGLYSAKLTNSTSSAIALWKSISITSGQQYTISAWIKNVSCPTTPYFSVSSGGTFNGTSSANSTTGVTAGSDWVYISKTFTATNTQGTNPYIRTSYSSTQGYFLVDDFQIENKTYSTPFANTTRSTTDGWKDLSTNDHDGSLINGTDTGTTHYRDGQVIMPVTNSYLDFDGSDDKVDCGSVTPDTGDFTVEFIYQLTGNGGRGGLFERKASSPYNGFSIGQGGSGNWGFAVSGTSNYSAGRNLTWTYPTLNTWYHDVGVYSGGNSVTIYRNGSFVDSTSGTAQGNLSTQGTRTNFLIANRDNLTSLPCKVGLVRVYNKALTAAEVLRNYNATKNRFT